MADQWFYFPSGRQVGPVSWEQLQALAQAGQLAPDQLVWREGMPQPTPARDVPGLLSPLPEPVPVALDYAPRDDPHVRRAIRNARDDCVTMFVLFCMVVTTTAGAGVVRALGRFPGAEHAPATAWIFAMMGACYALSLLSSRQQRQLIMGLPASYRILGLIGGFGLVSLLVLGLVVLVLVVALLH